MGKSRKTIVDCTHMIHEGMPVFPGSDRPVLDPVFTFDALGFREKKWTIFSHTGTHMDAPAHMKEDGKTLDQFPAETFMGKGFVLDVRECTAEEIPLTRIKPFEKILKEIDFLLIQTGWEVHWGSDQYFEGFSALSAEAAEYLMTFELKGIGIDAISIDRMDTKTYPIHKILFRHKKVIIENLKNLSVLSGVFNFQAFPLHVVDADGSPVRAIAVVEE